MSATRALSRLIDARLAPAFLQSGFDRTDVVSLAPHQIAQFQREASVGLQLINIQCDKRWEATRGKFALNLGLYSPAVEVCLGNTVHTGVPSGGYWTLTLRSGFLTHGRDHWYLISTQSDESRLGAELNQAWAQHILPWFDQTATFAGARDEMCRRGRPDLAAALSLSAGDRTAARQLLGTCLRSRSHPDNSELDWGASHGLVTIEEQARLRIALIQDTETLTRAIDAIFGQPRNSEPSA